MRSSTFLMVLFAFWLPANSWIDSACGQSRSWSQDLADRKDSRPDTDEAVFSFNNSYYFLDPDIYHNVNIYVFEWGIDLYDNGVLYSMLYSDIPDINEFAPFQYFVVGGNVGNTINVFGNSSEFVEFHLQGGNGVDNISNFSWKRSWQHGGGNNDSLSGGFDQDLLFGDDGNDFLDGGDDNDFLNGGDGDDELHGGNGNDQLRGDDGADELWGEFGNDILQGGWGPDELHGGFGDDQLIGRGDKYNGAHYLPDFSVDLMWGGQDSDTFESVYSVWYLWFVPAGDSFFEGVWILAAVDQEVMMDYSAVDDQYTSGNFFGMKFLPIPNPN